MSNNIKILFGIFCLMLTLVFLYALTALGFNGNDSAFIILVLAVISLVSPSEQVQMLRLSQRILF